MENWIDIGEYSTRYGISQSTLRRRIRANSIPFKMERGKYLLQDSPESMNRAPLFARVSQLRQKNASTASSIVVSSPERQTPTAKNNSTSVASSRRSHSETLSASYSSARASINQGTYSLKLPDPVEDFISLSQVLPIHFKGEMQLLKQENRRLKARIEELETLVKVLDPEAI